MSGLGLLGVEHLGQLTGYVDKDHQLVTVDGRNPKQPPGMVPKACK